MSDFFGITGYISDWETIKRKTTRPNLIGKQVAEYRL